MYVLCLVKSYSYEYPENAGLDFLLIIFFFYFESIEQRISLHNKGEQIHPRYKGWKGLIEYLLVVLQIHTAIHYLMWNIFTGHFLVEDQDDLQQNNVLELVNSKLSVQPHSCFCIFWSIAICFFLRILSLNYKHFHVCTLVNIFAYVVDGLNWISKLNIDMLIEQFTQLGWVRNKQSIIETSLSFESIRIAVLKPPSLVFCFRYLKYSSVQASLQLNPKVFQACSRTFLWGWMAEYKFSWNMLFSPIRP